MVALADMKGSRLRCAQSCRSVFESPFVRSLLLGGLMLGHSPSCNCPERGLIKEGLITPW